MAPAPGFDPVELPGESPHPVLGEAGVRNRNEGGG
jgi:hypothetical protein